MIGIQARSEMQASIAAAEIVPNFKNHRGAALQVLPGATRVAEDRISYQNGTLQIVCSGKLDAMIDVFVAARGTVDLSLSTPGAASIDLQVQDGVIISNGVVTNVRPEGIHHLVLQSSSQFPPTPAQAVGVGKLLDANVSLGETKNHVRSYTQPRLRVPMKPGLGVLRLEIDESGHVGSISGASAKLLDSEAMETIRAWLFEPFALQGRLARVVAAVPFHIDPTGTVITALDPSARLY